VGLIYYKEDKNGINGKGGIWKRVIILKQQKFNYKELMKHEPKTKIIVEEENQPNLDRMAKAIWKLLSK